MKRILANLLLALACLAGAQGQSIISGTANAQSAPTHTASATNGAFVPMYYTLAWVPLSTPFTSCQIALGATLMKGYSAGAAVAAQNCSSAGSATSSQVNASSVAVEPAIKGGGSIFYWVTTSPLAPSSGATVQTATVTLTTAQILSMHAHPVVIVPAPGLGNILFPIMLNVQYKFGTIPFANVGDPGSTPLDYAFGQPGGGTTSTVNFPAVGFINQSTDQLLVVGYSGNASIAPRTDIENSPLVLQNDSFEFTTGDGQMVVTAYYTVVTLQ